MSRIEIENNRIAEAVEKIMTLTESDDERFGTRLLRRFSDAYRARVPAASLLRSVGNVLERLIGRSESEYDRLGYRLVQSVGNATQKIIALYEGPRSLVMSQIEMIAMQALKETDISEKEKNPEFTRALERILERRGGEFNIDTLGRVLTIWERVKVTYASGQVGYESEPTDALVSWRDEIDHARECINRAFKEIGRKEDSREDDQPGTLKNAVTANDEGKAIPKVSFDKPIGTTGRPLTGFVERDGSFNLTLRLANYIDRELHVRISPKQGAFDVVIDLQGTENQWDYELDQLIPEAYYERIHHNRENTADEVKKVLASYGLSLDEDTSNRLVEYQQAQVRSRAEWIEKYGYDPWGKLTCGGLVRCLREIAEIGSAVHEDGVTLTRSAQVEEAARIANQAIKDSIVKTTIIEEALGDGHEHPIDRIVETLSSIPKMWVLDALEDLEYDGVISLRRGDQQNNNRDVDEPTHAYLRQQDTASLWRPANYNLVEALDIIETSEWYNLEKDTYPKDPIEVYQIYHIGRSDSDEAENDDHTQRHDRYGLSEENDHKEGIYLCLKSEGWQIAYGPVGSWNDVGTLWEGIKGQIDERHALGVQEIARAALIKLSSSAESRNLLTQSEVQITGHVGEIPPKSVDLLSAEIDLAFGHHLLEARKYGVTGDVYIRPFNRDVMLCNDAAVGTYIVRPDGNALVARGVTADEMLRVVKVFDPTAVPEIERLHEMTIEGITLKPATSIQYEIREQVGNNEIDNVNKRTIKNIEKHSMEL